MRERESDGVRYCYSSRGDIVPQVEQVDFLFWGTEEVKDGMRYAMGGRRRN